VGVFGLYIGVFTLQGPMMHLQIGFWTEVTICIAMQTRCTRPRNIALYISAEISLQKGKGKFTFDFRLRHSSQAEDTGRLRFRKTISVWATTAAVWDSAGLEGLGKRGTGLRIAK
jgi:hypothetical protein